MKWRGTIYSEDIKLLPAAVEASVEMRSTEDPLSDGQRTGGARRDKAEDGVAAAAETGTGAQMVLPSLPSWPGLQLSVGQCFQCRR